MFDLAYAMGGGIVLADDTIDLGRRRLLLLLLLVVGGPVGGVRFRFVPRFSRLRRLRWVDESGWAAPGLW